MSKCLLKFKVPTFFPALGVRVSFVACHIPKLLSWQTFSFTWWQGLSFAHEFFSHVFQCPFPFPPTFYFPFSSFFLFHFSCGDCCKQKWSIVEVARICIASVEVFVRLPLPSFNFLLFCHHHYFWLSVFQVLLVFLAFFFEVFFETIEHLF